MLRLNRLCRLLIVWTGVAFASAATASSVKGGQLTLNLDRDLLAAAFTHDTSERPAFYLEEYFDASQAAIHEPLLDHVIPGTAEINATGLRFAVNDAIVAEPNKATDFNFNPAEMASANGQIGLGGAMRFRLDVPFQVNPDTGEEVGNRAVAGYLSLEYEDGWTLYNHYSFRAAVFDLVDVVTAFNGDSLSLTGNMLLGQGFGHMGGQVGSRVGDFSFQTTVVPVPAAWWLFVSAIGGLFISRRTVSAVS